MAHLARAERRRGSPPIAGARGRGPPNPPAAAARGLSRRSQRGGEGAGGALRRWRRCAGAASTPCLGRMATWIAPNSGGPRAWASAPCKRRKHDVSQPTLPASLLSMASKVQTAGPLLLKAAQCTLASAASACAGLVSAPSPACWLGLAPRRATSGRLRPPCPPRPPGLDSDSFPLRKPAKTRAQRQARGAKTRFLKCRTNDVKSTNPCQCQWSGLPVDSPAGRRAGRLPGLSRSALSP